MADTNMGILDAHRKERSLPEAADAGRGIEVLRLVEVRADLLDDLREVKTRLCWASVTIMHNSLGGGIFEELSL